MAELERRNGKIDGVKFEIEDGGLRLNLSVSGKGWGVCVVSPSFSWCQHEDTPEEEIQCNSQAVKKLHELLKFFDAHRLEDLKGKIVTCEFRNYNIFNKFIDIIDDEKEFKW